MTRLDAAAIDSFLRRYRFPGGRLARVKFIHRRGQLDIVAVLVVRTAIKDLGDTPKTTRLRIRFVNVEECRFQKRLQTSLSTLPDFKLGFLDGSFFATFDSWNLQSNERPAIHDFRSGEAYIGCRDVLTDEIA